MNSSLIYNNILEKTERYLEQNNIRNIIIGLSGGVDSTLSTLIIYDIMQRNPNKYVLIGVNLPSSTTTNEETFASLNVGNTFCTTYFTENIDNLVKSFEDISIKYYKISKYSNDIKQRVRMTLLYNIASNEQNSCIIDVNNKSELNLGFVTLHGECGDLNIIGDLWKHEIYKLMVYKYNEFNKTDKRLAEAIFPSISLVPSDGEVPDMKKLNFNISYDEVDDILITFIDKIKWYWDSIEEPIDPYDKEFALKIQAIYEYKNLVGKYGKEVVDLIINKNIKTSYIRKQYPHIIK